MSTSEMTGRMVGSGDMMKVQGNVGIPIKAYLSEIEID